MMKRWNWMTNVHDSIHHLPGLPGRPLEMTNFSVARPTGSSPTARAYFFWAAKTSLTLGNCENRENRENCEHELWFILLKRGGRNYTAESIPQKISSGPTCQTISLTWFNHDQKRQQFRKFRPPFERRQVGRSFSNFGTLRINIRVYITYSRAPNESNRKEFHMFESSNEPITPSSWSRFLVRTTSTIVMDQICVSCIFAWHHQY